MAAAVVVVIGTWSLVTPPNAGPDEVGHMVRSVAVVQGAPGDSSIVAPAWIAWPDISCYALYSDRPASCASSLDGPSDEVLLVTRAGEYPIWGHLVPGAAVKMSSASTSPYLARLASAIVAAGLVVASLSMARRRAPVAGALTLLALTPMAWFTFAVVNPSGPAIAGALAVWVSMLFVRSSAAQPWLFTVGLAAAMLPRRDSVFWAAAVLVAAAIATDTSLLARVRALPRSALAVLVASIVASGWWAFDNGVQTTGLFGLSAGLVVGHEAWRVARAAGGARRHVADTVAVASSVVVAAALMITRDGGFDSALFGTIVGETGSNLLEAVGAVGTLDARIPLWAFWMFVVLVVAIAGLSWTVAETLATRRAVVAGVGVLVVAVVAAWALEMARGNTTGTYWQGRYSLPLLLGVPMLVGLPLVTTTRRDVERLACVAAASGAALTSVVTFAAAVRRWGVGTTGSWDPRAWDTYGAPVSTSLLIALHAVAAVCLAWSVAADAPASVNADGRR